MSMRSIGLQPPEARPRLCLGLGVSKGLSLPGHGGLGAASLPSDNADSSSPALPTLQLTPRPRPSQEHLEEWGGDRQQMPPLIKV